MIKEFKISYGEMNDPLAPIRKLVLAIFERALRDALYEYGVSRWHSPRQRDDALAWLLSESQHEGSACWWAEMTDAQQVRLACIKAIREHNIGVIRNYCYKRVSKF